MEAYRVAGAFIRFAADLGPSPQGSAYCRLRQLIKLESVEIADGFLREGNSLRAEMVPEEMNCHGPILSGRLSKSHGAFQRGR
jgi:hypothetical protein